MPTSLLYAPHVAVGVLTLTLFWRTLLSIKGSPPHRRRGRWYFATLIPLLVSVVPITALAVAEEGPARLVQLVYLAVVVMTAGWTAWRAVRDRDDVERFRGRVFTGLAVTMAGLGTMLLAIGILRTDVLAVGFSVIGIVYGGAMLGFLGRAPQPGWSLAWHLNGVCLLFAATHASFLGLVMRNLLPHLEGEAMHAATQLGTIAFAYLLRQGLALRYEGGGRLPAALPA